MFLLGSYLNWRKLKLRSSWARCLPELFLTPLHTNTFLLHILHTFTTPGDMSGRETMLLTIGFSVKSPHSKFHIRRHRRFKLTRCWLEENWLKITDSRSRFHVKPKQKKCRAECKVPWNSTRPPILDSSSPVWRRHLTRRWGAWNCSLATSRDLHLPGNVI